MFNEDPFKLVGQRRSREVLASCESASSVDIPGKKTVSFEVMPTDQLLHVIETLAFDFVNPSLAEGYRTVGVSVSFRHFSPVPAGHKAVVSLVLTSMEGKKFVFDFEVGDALGTVCKGSYANYIVEVADFNSTIATKRNQLAALAEAGEASE